MKKGTRSGGGERTVARKEPFNSAACLVGGKRRKIQGSWIIKNI
jgi:hypothetical protein